MIKLKRLLPAILMCIMLLTISTAQAVFEPCENHDWQFYGYRVRPTCTEPGTAYYQCTKCGEGKTQSVPATGHSFSDWHAIKEATCTEYGRKSHTCSVCGYKQTATIEKSNHTWGEWSVVLPANYSTNGIMWRACSVCGHTEQKIYYPERTLRKGDSSDAVRVLQQLLIDRGFNFGRVNGTFGQKTEDAIRLVEEQIGIPLDGIAWPIVIDWLHPSDYWTEWTSNGNGTHSRYGKENPSESETLPCCPSQDDETVCATCGGTFIDYGKCIAPVDIPVYSDYPPNDVDLIASMVIGVIPQGTAFTVYSNNGDFAVIDFNGSNGIISSIYINFVNDNWSEWSCNGNGTHSRYKLSDQNVTEISQCIPNDDETFCTQCGGAYIKSGVAVAQTDIPVYSDCPPNDDELRDAMIIATIPTGATYYVTGNSIDYCNVEYNGMSGVISNFFVYFVADETDENADEWSEWVCSNNGTHTRHKNDDPYTVQIRPCYPDDENQIRCAECHGYLVTVGAHEAQEDIWVYRTNPDDNPYFDAEQVCLMKKGSIYYVNALSGNYCEIVYNGLVGWIGIEYDHGMIQKWSEWTCNGNGTHSRFNLYDPESTQTDPCFPNEDQTICAICQGAFINSGICIALEDITVYSDCPPNDDELRQSMIIGTIPEGATYHVTSNNGDYAEVEYSGQSGVISISYINFVGTDN